MMLQRFVNDICKYLRYSIVSAKAQLKAEIANSYLNWMWWILEPLCMMLVYSFIFGNVFGMRMENYAVFIFIGISMYDFFSRGIKSSVKIIKRNKQIISKVYIPKFVLVLSDLFVSGFKMLMCLVVVFVMIIATGIPLTWNILFMLPILVDFYIVTFAICMFLSHFGVFVEDLSNVINIVLKFLFYFTGIFYSIKDKFPPKYADLTLNVYPVANLINNARDACMYGKGADIWYLVILFFISSAAAIAGVTLVYKNENSYIKLV